MANLGPLGEETEGRDIANLTAKQEKHMANLGPLGVVRETVRLCWEHPKFFFFVMYFTLVAMMFVWAVPPTINPGLYIRLSCAYPGGAATDPLLAVLEYPPAMNSSDFVNQARRSLWMITPFYSVVPFWFTGPPTMPVILYAVGHIYTGSRVSVRDVVNNILWKRVVATRLVYILLIIGIFLVTFARTFWLAGKDALLPMVLTYGCMLVLDIIFEIAEAVSVLEEDYGWAAFKKSVKLLSRGRIWVAVGVVVLLNILSAVPQYFLSTWIQTVDMQPSNLFLTLFFLAVLTRSFLMCLMAQFNWFAGGVMYVSFKAYHNKSIFTDSSETIGS